MSFVIPALIFAFILIASVIALNINFKKKNELWRSLPREKNVATVISLFVFFYAAWHGRYMLEGPMEHLQVYVWVVYPVVILLFYFFLDFQFARILGGALVILATHLNHEALVVYIIDFKWLLGLNNILLGTIGLFFIGMPWLFRNMLQKAEDNSGFKRLLLSYLTFVALLLISFSLSVF